MKTSNYPMNNNRPKCKIVRMADSSLHIIIPGEKK